MHRNPFNTRLGLALGGGGSKGLAHISVIKAIKERNVQIDFLSGTSAGALVASYYAFGKDLKNFDNLTHLLRAKAIFNFNIGKLGLMSTNSLRESLLAELGDLKIEDAQIPLAICTTDINTGESIYLRQGSLVNALCASVAVPGIFKPVSIGDRLLVDGGISNNVPIEILEKMGAGITVGVDLNGVSSYPNVTNVFDVIRNAVDIAIDLRTQEQMKRATVAISLDLSEYSRFDNYDKTDQLMGSVDKMITRKIEQVMMYKKFHILYYLFVITKELIPLKIPKLFGRKAILSIK